MKPFLQKIAEEIASRFGDDPGSLCVVLPNRRAGLYLRKYLAAELKRDAWAPQTFSIEDFVINLSKTPIIDPMGLLFEFYAVHREVAGDQAQDFELFAEWGQVLLKDFDEIDQYLADPDKVFTYLDEARALSVWNLGEQPLTSQEQDYIRFYQSFREYYFRLKERLIKKKQVYQGLAYRIGAEGIEQFSAGLPWKKIFFAGLNALATAEEKIIGYLLDNDRAEVFWDADEYYIRDEGQEAGTFIRQHFKHWPADPVKWLEKEFRESKKEIFIYGIPKSTGQAIKAGQIVSQPGRIREAPDNTALVLADESLLLPVLYALPENIGAVNVTMGFPFRYTNLYQLIHLVFKLQENSERYSQDLPVEKRKYYARDILKIFSHPFLYLWQGSDEFKDDPDLIAGNIRLKNRIFFTSEEIIRMCNHYSGEFTALISEIFGVWSSPEIILDHLLHIMEIIRRQMSRRVAERSFDHDLDFEYLFHMSRVIRRCRSLMPDLQFQVNIKSLRKVLFQVLDTSRLPFYGEPLKGLQIMGVLETRALDFENLIILSVNEGILPSGRNSGSFIPFDIKKVFGLPTFQRKDAVFAYHFYRMIQRASNIFLLYDTEGDMMKGGEKSRYITQIAYELKKYNNLIVIHDDLVIPAPPETGKALISMPKTERVQKILAEKVLRGFSPSALNLYIRCPLQFYFQEVIGLSEMEELEETIESKTLGTVIHDVLYQVYKPFEGNYVEPARLRSRLDLIEGLLKQAFEKYYQDGDLEHGKNHLAFKVSQFLINQLIKFESELLEKESNPGRILKILHLEEKLETHIDCRSGNKVIKVRIKGKADRIDQWGEELRVIDYKTGLVRQEELKVKSWDELITDPAMGKAFQLLIYAFLFHENDKFFSGNMSSGNLTLRKISDYIIPVKLPDDQPVNDESMKLFKDILTELVETILNPDIPFDQTDDTEICVYCPFRAICSR